VYIDRQENAREFGKVGVNFVNGTFTKNVNQVKFVSD